MKAEEFFPSLRSEVDRLFETLVHTAWKEGRRNWNPSLDVTERRDLYRLEMDLPGVKGPDISITTEGSVLRIEGYRDRPRPHVPETHHVIERDTGRFLRTIRLPDGVDLSQMRVRLADGVLTIEIPKTETWRRR